MNWIKLFAMIVIAMYWRSTYAIDTAYHKLHLTPLPILLYNPYTGFGFGALANANFVLGNATHTRVSNAQAYLVYTTHKQLAIQLNQLLFTNHERWLIQGKIQYLNWPEYAYALGGNTSVDTPVKELISYKALELEERVMIKIGAKNFAGIQFRTFLCTNLKSDIRTESSFFDTAAIGNTSFRSIGIGFHFIHDSRDNVQNSYTGNYLELAINPYLKALGSTENWVNYRADFRTFISLGTYDHPKILALRGLYEQATGRIPFMLTPMFGRYNTTRGYVQGRYRGKLFVTAEAEFRAHLYKRLGYVVFANVNAVDEPNGRITYLNPAMGGGLRIMLQQDQRINLRVDYAVGLKGNSGLYLQVAEMF